MIVVDAIDAVGHVVTAIAEAIGAAIDGGAVGRAMVDVGVAVIGEDQGLDLGYGVGVLAGDAVAPAHHVLRPGTADPVAVAGGRPVNEVVRRHHVLVVVGVHAPTDAELLQIVQALGGPGLFLGLGEGGQQQRRENGDDGDD